MVIDEDDVKKFVHSHSQRVRNNRISLEYSQAAQSVENRCKCREQGEQRACSQEVSSEDS